MPHFTAAAPGVGRRCRTGAPAPKVPHQAVASRAIRAVLSARASRRGEDRSRSTASSPREVTASRLRVLDDAAGRSRGRAGRHHQPVRRTVVREARRCPQPDRVGWPVPPGSRSRAVAPSRHCTASAKVSGALADRCRREPSMAHHSAGATGAIFSMTRRRVRRHRRRAAPVVAVRLRGARLVDLGHSHQHAQQVRLGAGKR